MLHRTIIQKKKINSTTENNKLVDVTPKITKSLVDRRLSSTKKLSLTKPRKRRCNFSPTDSKEATKKMEKKSLVSYIYVGPPTESQQSNFGITNYNTIISRSRRIPFPI